MQSSAASAVENARPVPPASGTAVPGWDVRTQVIVATVLSLSTLFSTFCAYRSQVWSGRSADAATAASLKEREAGEDAVLGMQVRTIDGLRVIAWWQAHRQGDTRSADLMRSHFPQRLTVALDASVAGGALTTPGAAGPLERPEYVVPEEVKAREGRAEAARLRASSDAAGALSSRYVLLTLLFSSVLFLGGIVGIFDRPRIRLTLALASVALFSVVTAWLLAVLSGWSA